MVTGLTGASVSQGEGGASGKARGREVGGVRLGGAGRDVVGICRKGSLLRVWLIMKEVLSSGGHCITRMVASPKDLTL